MNAKLTFSVFFIGMILSNNMKLAAQKIFDNRSFSIIQVVNNTDENTITLAWNDNRFDEIEIQNQDGLFMPSIPVMNAKQLHLNDLIEGYYLVLFKSQNEIIATKEFKVTGNGDLAKN